MQTNADAGNIEISPTEFYLKQKEALLQRNSAVRFYIFAQYLYLPQKMGNCSSNVQNRNFLVAARDCSMDLNHSNNFTNFTTIQLPFEHHCWVLLGYQRVLSVTWESTGPYSTQRQTTIGYPLVPSSTLEYPDSSRAYPKSTHSGYCEGTWVAGGSLG